MWRWQSLKVRLSVTTVGICLIVLWSLFFFGYQLVRKDSEKLIGEQQFATARIAADLISELVTQQFVALEHAAAEITPELLARPQQLQGWLDRQPSLHELFNGAIYVTGLDGVGLAAFPHYQKMMETSFADRDYIAAALKEGAPRHRQTDDEQDQGRSVHRSLPFR